MFLFYIDFHFANKYIPGWDSVTNFFWCGLQYSGITLFLSGDTPISRWLPSYDYYLSIGPALANHIEDFKVCWAWRQSINITLHVCVCLFVLICMEGWVKKGDQSSNLESRFPIPTWRADSGKTQGASITRTQTFLRLIHALVLSLSLFLSFYFTFYDLWNIYVLPERKIRQPIDVDV